jgi:hypothetical protein
LEILQTRYFSNTWLTPHPSCIVIEIEAIDWVTEISDEGERYSYPPLLNSLGFFEAFLMEKKMQFHSFGGLLIIGLRLPAKILTAET